MGVVQNEFGTTQKGQKAYLYTLSNTGGMEVQVTNFGAILVSVKVKDSSSQVKDVVLGYDSLKEYEKNEFFFGSTIGRNANRIKDAVFSLDGKEYRLAVNEGPNNLHSDADHGFHKVLWNAEVKENANAVTFCYASPDQENGFPGNLNVSVTYSLSEDNALSITYEGISDQKTVMNMTNHSYFNLNGQGSGSICDEKVTIFADGFTEVGEGSIPTGRIIPVEGTPLDFRSPRRVGDDIDDDFEQLNLVGGYDHNFALNSKGETRAKAACVEDDRSGICMKVYTDLPGIQFYTGNFVKPHTGKNGAKYDKRGGLCLETQFFPNSINMPEFKQPILEAGKKFTSTTTYAFSVR